MATALAGEIYGAHISILSSTDFVMGREIVITGKVLRENPSLIQLCNWVKKEYFNMTGKHIREKSSDGIKAVTFIGMGGGRGVTTLALSLGRTLAGKFGRKPLYITDREENLTCYDIGREEVAVNPVKLDYYLKEGRDFLPEEVMLRDPLGLYMAITREKELLREYLSEKGDFDRLIFDCREALEKDKDTKSISLINALDLRGNLVHEDGSLILVNRVRGLYEGSKFYIEDSPESFTINSEGKIEIAMDRSFGAGIARLAAWLEEEENG